MAGRGPRPSGLFKTEQAVMDLHDRGLSTNAISAQLGMDRRRVRQIVSMYAEDFADRRWRRAIARYDAAFIARIREKMPHLLTSGGGE